MTDQTLDAVPAPPRISARAFFAPGFEARALAPTAKFWFAMFVASALGANIGDFWAGTLGLGLETSFASMAVICALMIWGDCENGSRTESFYWIAIVCLRAAATNVGDFFTHTLSMNYLLATVVLGAATLVLGYFTQPAFGGASPKIDLRYWAAMFVGGVFGTIGGDLVSHSVGLLLAAVLLGVLLMAVIRLRGLAAPTAMVAYWCVVLAERAAGTPMGDWLANGHGLDLGLPLSILLTTAILLIALFFRDGFRARTDPSGGLAAQAVFLLPTLRLLLFVLSLLGCFFMMRIYVVDHPRDPSFVLSYGIGLAINALYLGWQELASLGSWRAVRLVSLWFAVKRREFDHWAQTKEAELRERGR
jgi:uncharacterized membrane-anchored protein